jgi:xylulokinase
MWLKALDLLLERLANSEKKIDLSQIIAISGSGQQHGSIYWSEIGRKVLENLDSRQTLQQQFSNDNSCFARKNSPIWMDNSTTKQCIQLENLIGRKELTRITGSSAYQRFTL